MVFRLKAAGYGRRSFSDWADAICWFTRVRAVAIFFPEDSWVAPVERHVEPFRWLVFLQRLRRPTRQDHGRSRSRLENQPAPSASIKTTTADL